MNQSLPAIFRTIIDAVWRGRWLMVLPIVLIVPLGLLYAKFGPRTYVAKSLLLLQETSRDYPFARDAAGGRMQDRLAGLQALLKSERVLLRVMDDIADKASTGDPRKAAAWIRGFAGDISLDLVGNHFLEIRLKGDSPVGLGQQLSAVTSRFLEALLSSQDSLNATQVLLTGKKARLDETERRYAIHNEQLRAEMAQLESRKSQLAAKSQGLQAAVVEIEALRSQIESPGSSTPRTNEPDVASQPGPPSKQKLAELMKQAEARYATLASEVRQLERTLENMRSRIDDGANTDRQLRALHAETRESYQEYSRRYNSPVSAQSPGILSAPERIKLIDPPRDPEFPERTALKIALTAIAASFMIAAALVFFREMLDPTMRRADEIERVVDAPIIARLPSAWPGGMPRIDDAQVKKRLFRL